MRENKNADYIANLKDYTDAIDALDEGIQTLKAQAHDVKQAAAALTQVSSSSIVPAESKRIIDAFLAQDPDEKEETNARHAFEMLPQDLKAQIDQATQARTEIA